MKWKVLGNVLPSRTEKMIDSFYLDIQLVLKMYHNEIYLYFSYRTLAVKSDRGQTEDQNNVNSRRVVATWNVGLGEEASHIQIVPPVTKDVPSGIIVLGRRTLYMLQDTGVLTFSRKLDFCATSLRAFRPSKLL